MSAPSPPRYQLAPCLHIEREGDEVVLMAPVEQLRCAPETLLLLHHFCRPRSLDESVSVKFPPGMRGRPAAVDDLVRAGVLVSEGGGAISVFGSGFDSPELQARMLNDGARTSAYLDAIAATVRPGDVVLDLGTGTGVLAIAAAKAGARRVYAIEAGAIGALAERMVVENGVADRVRVIRGWSTSVALPERCNVLITETIGDDPLGEKILENVLDARRRLLTPEARLVPLAIHLCATVYAVPGANWRRHFNRQSAFAEWATKLSLPVDWFAAPSEWKPTWEQLAQWSVLEAPAALQSVSLTSHETAQVDAAVEVGVSRPGRVNAVAVSADVHLTSAISFRTDRPSPANSWRALVTGIEPFEVSAGQRARVRYRYGHGPLSISAERV